MTQNLTIGIIGGTGWMGKAMGEALLKKFLAPAQLWVCNASGKNTYTAPIHFTTQAQPLVDACDVIFLSVLPRQFPQLQINVRSALVISIMAMVSVETIQQHTHASRIVRAMPNAAIPEGESYIPWFAYALTSEDKKIAAQIFQCFGVGDEVPSEDALNFMTALTGSSHGWLAYLAESLIEAGVAHGLSSALIERGVRQVMKGVGRLIAHEKPTPQQTVKILTDYAGTTAAGLNYFAQSDFAKIVQKAIDAAYQKAKRL
jgi:pyrroline-5-carboxylate reductase